MNKKQVRVIWIGIALFLLTILLKSSIYFYFNAIINVGTIPKWLILFFLAPISQVIAVITIGLFVTFRDKKDDNPTDEPNNKPATR